MRRTPRSHAETHDFAWVTRVGLQLPDVEVGTKYDGTPVLRVGGAFMAGLATDEAAEPDTIVVRIDVEERAWLLEDAPDTYYLTDYHRPHPVVLVRLSRIDQNALRDLLSMARRATLPKARGRGRPRR